MNRRNFIKISGLASLSVLSECYHKRAFYKNYNINIKSDIHTGHLIFESQKFRHAKALQTDFMIVGGGIAGITAAYQLRNEKFILCELSHVLGGSSSAQSFQNTSFAQGAHYDLSYPNYFGEDVLHFLASLKIIDYHPIKSVWEFTDKQYYIDPEKDEICWNGHDFEDDVLPDSPEAHQFLDFADTFVGKLKLPTRLIDQKYHFLNKISFLDFLKQNVILNESLIRSINYQIMDDYGSTCDKVSALAGMYYYASRPYRTAEYATFSPPNGNYYFIQKMLNHLSQENIWTNHLVKKIEKQKKGFVVEVVDIQNQEVKIIKPQKIIYAGQKHALKYIFPQDAPLFADNEYAPWLVMNFVLKDSDSLNKGYWQNEFVHSSYKDADKQFMGFIDSKAQFSPNSTQRILTAYYCFEPAERKKLADIEDFAQDITNHTVENISLFFGIPKSELDIMIEKVFIKVMGHAMPIPKINYLFQDKNQQRSAKNLAYAGVDNSRLPLLLEAIDSGLLLDCVD
jgi:protoporphyrinogen oxidase